MYRYFLEVLKQLSQYSGKILKISSNDRLHSLKYEQTGNFMCTASSVKPDENKSQTARSVRKLDKSRQP